jgi:hypothetical protein
MYIMNKRLVCEIPDTLHKDLKILAVKWDMSLRNALIRLLKYAMSQIDLEKKVRFD